MTLPSRKQILVIAAEAGRVQTVRSAVQSRDVYTELVMNLYSAIVMSSTQVQYYSRMSVTKSVLTGFSKPDKPCIQITMYKKNFFDHFFNQRRL